MEELQICNKNHFTSYWHTQKFEYRILKNFNA